MRQFEKERLQRRSSLREHLPRPNSTSDAPVKLIFVLLFVLGAILVWSKQDEIALAAETTALLSPIASFVMQHILAVYLLVGGAFLTIFILFPLGKKAAQDQLRSIGLVNHTDMVPALKRKYKDKQNPRISVWEFTSQGIPLKTWEDKQASIETILDITIVKMKYGSGKSRVLLYTVPARTDLPEVIDWNDKYLSHKTAGFDPGTGKQIQRSITGKTQKEVSQKLKAALAALDSGTYIAPCKMTVAEWLDVWASQYLGGVKESTVAAYNATIRTHIKPGLGAIRLDALDTHLVQSFYNGLREPTKDRAAVSEKRPRNPP